MTRKASPWYWQNRGEWCIIIRGKRHRLCADKDEAERRSHELLAARPNPQPLPKTTVVTVVSLFDKFLDYCEKHCAGSHLHRPSASHPGFLERRRRKRQGFPAEKLKPFHVIEWIDKHPAWGPTYRRMHIISVQRPYAWAIKLGYIETNPIRSIDKPPCQRRELAVTPEQWPLIRDHYADGSPFRDLLEFLWETGCRPQEARAIEHRHICLDRLCVLFPPGEAKDKKRWRIIR